MLDPRNPPAQSKVHAKADKAKIDAKAGKANAAATTTAVKSRGKAEVKAATVQ